MTRCFLCRLWLCLLLSMHCSAGAAPLERLFFSAAERQRLEQTSPPGAPEAASAISSIHFGGMLWRDEKLISLWVDHHAQPPGGRLRADLKTGRLVVQDTGGPDLQLRAGEHWPPSSSQRLHPIGLHRTTSRAAP